jgi:hypothetical protein
LAFLGVKGTPKSIDIAGARAIEALRIISVSSKYITALERFNGK